MNRIDATTIATTILTAPGWARVGIAAPTETMRDAAASELARAIIERIGDDECETSNPDQLPLAL